MEKNSFHTLRNMSDDSLHLMVKHLSKCLMLLEITHLDFSRLDEPSKKIIELYSYCFNLMVERWQNK